MKAPTFSIISVTKDNHKGLKATLESVKQQSNKDYELIVIDGHSSDATSLVLDEFDDIISCTELDQGYGIYDAMNQGASLANGNWLIFMNAGDRFFSPHVLKTVAPRLDGDLSYGWVWRNGAKEREKHLPINQISKGNAFCHQALFTKREWVLRFPFRKEYQIASDYDFYLNCYFNSAIFQQLDIDIALVENDGISDRKYFKRIWETYKVGRKYFPEVMVFWNFLSKFKDGILRRANSI